MAGGGCHRKLYLEGSLDPAQLKVTQQVRGSVVIRNLICVPPFSFLGADKAKLGASMENPCLEGILWGQDLIPLCFFTQGFPYLRKWGVWLNPSASIWLK